ncbi:MAG: acyltransferase domain-containing protein [Pseudomonadota bacterium]
MRTRIVFAFSGQGSQYFQMGRSLYERNMSFKRSMDRLDAVATDLSGNSIVRTLYGDRSKSEPFDELSLSHPAIYMVEMSLAQALIDAGIVPDLLLGSSLGSLAAAAVSGCIQPEDGVSLAIAQAEAIQSHCAPGRMIAILANSALHRAETMLRQHSVIAAYNFANHFVVAAPRKASEAIEDMLLVRGHVHQCLPVTYAFHSPWMEQARPSYLAASKAVKFDRAQIPLACCASADIVNTLAPDYFWNVTHLPILFSQTIELLESHGPYLYVDLGPSGTVATFLKYLLPPHSSSRMQTVMTPMGRDVENFNTTIATVRSL